jgi:hypothetical protein
VAWYPESQSTLTHHLRTATKSHVINDFKAYNSSVICHMMHFWKSLNQFYWAKFKLKRLKDQQAIGLLFDACPKLSRVMKDNERRLNTGWQKQNKSTWSGKNLSNECFIGLASAAILEARHRCEDKHSWWVAHLKGQRPCCHLPSPLWPCLPKTSQHFPWGQFTYRYLMPGSLNGSSQISATFVMPIKL